VSLSLVLPGEGPSDLEEWAVYDVRGQRITTLHSGSYDQGEYRRMWGLTDQEGHRVPPGTYFVRARTAASTLTARVTVAPR
jgi:flagellar hook assembly protein FlgD